ncbi:hypothetical protein [Nonomuraea insulae]|uniref:N-acetylneuraminate epimerase n=1 Tax=Nonomuraea insulae TaxID=1616787 RepID=A0ABW1CVF6_9ACTN
MGDYTGTAGAHGYTEAAIGAITLAEDQRLTLDVPLEPLASQVVSGTVTDGGGQGWPLYARVEVEGVPGAPVFTDPATGTYAVKLPLGHRYRLTISAEFPGYLPKSETVDLGDKPVTLNTALPVDAGKANAAGYSLTYPDGGVQTFDERTAPVGWTVRDNNDKGGWRFDDPLGRSNQTGGGGGFAIVDDFAEGWAKLDTELLSPAYDLTKVKTPVAEFETHFPPLEQLDVPKATVDVSVDGGTTWSTAWTSPKTLAGPAHVSVPLAAFAGEKDVRLRFHYVGGLGNMWEIDKVAVGTRTFAPVKGGLVVGLVSDANTGEGVLGATVYSEGHSHGHGHGHRDKPQTEGRAITVATPDDTALGDGLYGLFSPETGRREVTADKAAFGYPATSEAARVTSGTVRADIALAAGRISVTPAAVDSAVTWGGDKDVTVTVRNTGKGPATFTVGEQPGGGTAPTTLTETGTPAAGTPPHRVKAGPPTGFGSGHKGEPGQAAPRPGDTWRTLADLDMGATGMVAGTYDGKLYAGTGARDDGTNRFSNAFASYDPESGKWTTLSSPWYRRWSGVGGFINGRFYVTSGRDTRGKTVAATEFYDPATDKWQTVAPNPTPYGSSGSAVLDGKLYVVGGCYMGPQGGDTCANSTVMVYDPAADKWSKTTSYPLGISHLACGGVAGKVYCAGGGSRGGATSDGFAYDPETAAWTAIADMPVDLMASAYTSANGKLLVSTGYSTGLGAITNEGYAYDPAAGTWSPLPNANVATTFAAGAPGFYVVGGDSPETGAPLTQLEQLPGYDQPHGQVAWMSVKARATTLRAGQSVKVTLKLAADRRATSVLTAYTATVVLDTDTPYRATTVPVTMRVVKRH